MSETILPANRKPPTKGSKLFAPGPPWRPHADLTVGAANWDAYALGYKVAGDLLAGHVGDSPFHSNVLGFPVVYLYRHYLELRLKDLLVLTARLLGLPEEAPEGHHLLDLWQKLRPGLQQIRPEGKGDFDAVEDTIEQFAELDPSSETFRYPVYKDGRSTLRFTPQRVAENRDIDVVRLRETVDAIEGVLDACSTGMSELLEANAEAVAEGRTEAARYQAELGAY